MLGAPDVTKLVNFVDGGPMSSHHRRRVPVYVFQFTHRSRRTLLLAATALSIASGSAWAADGDANDALLKKLDRMEQRIQQL